MILRRIPILALLTFWLLPALGQNADPSLSKWERKMAGLAEGLASDQRTLRLQALAKIDGLRMPARVVPSLVAILKDEEAAPRLQAMGALANTGPEASAAVPAMETMLQTESGQYARAVIRALGSIGAPAVPALLRVLKDESFAQRRMVVQTLGEIGPEAEQAVPALIAIQMRHGDGITHESTAALGRIGLPAIPALIEALPNPLGGRASSSLARMGAAAIPGLLPAMSHQAPAIRRGIAEALREMGPQAQSATPALIAALGDGDAAVRAASASALEAIGSKARAALPTLIATLDDDDATVRVNAAAACLALDPTVTEAVPVLLGGLDSKRAAYGASYVGPGTVGAVPALVGALREGGKKAYFSTYMLERIGPRAATAIPALVTALGQAEPLMPAAKAIVTIEPTNTAVTPFLIEALKNGSSGAAHQLGRLHPPRPEAVAPLTAALKHKDVSVRTQAAQSLGQMGVVARSALPALQAALTDESWKEGQALHGEAFLGKALKQAAQEALTAIRDALQLNPPPFTTPR
ncbi:MAG: HEAT repeat protein [Rhodothermales bacterium]|jgi:HEAT repeat protein